MIDKLKIYVKVILLEVGYSNFKLILIYWLWVFNMIIII